MSTPDSNVLALSETKQKLVHRLASLGGASAGGKTTELVRELARVLPAYMVPSLRVIDALPKNANGKLDRAALARISIHRSDEAATPRTPTELRVHAIWQKLLPKAFGRSDDFFDAGGNSLLVPALRARIEKEFGVSLAVRAFFTERTIERIAVAIDEARERSDHEDCVVPLRAEGDEAPLFCVHAVDGQASSFFGLAEALGPGRRVFALQRPESLEAAAASDVVTRADVYVEHLVSAHPLEAYRLLGFSFGGLVAFEMARALLRRGHAVTFLGVLDTGIYLEGDPDDFAMERSLLEFLENAHRLGVEIPGLAPVARNMRESLVAQKTYRPQPLDLDVHLFRPEGRAVLGEQTIATWRGLARSTTLRAVPGAHETMLAPSNVHATARIVASALDGSESA